MSLGIVFKGPEGIVARCRQSSYAEKKVQYLVGHSDPNTTQIYDRRKQKVSRNLVERISV